MRFPFYFTHSLSPPRLQHQPLSRNLAIGTLFLTRIVEPCRPVTPQRQRSTLRVSRSVTIVYLSIN